MDGLTLSSSPRDEPRSTCEPVAAGLTPGSTKAAAATRSPRPDHPSSHRWPLLHPDLKMQTSRRPRTKRPARDRTRARAVRVGRGTRLRTRDTVVGPLRRDCRRIPVCVYRVKTHVGGRGFLGSGPPGRKTRDKRSKSAPCWDRTGRARARCGARVVASVRRPRTRGCASLRRRL